MTRLSGRQPLQVPHIVMVITSRSGLLIETRTILTGLKQFSIVCRIIYTRIYEFLEMIPFFSTLSNLLSWKSFLKCYEKLSKFKRGVDFQRFYFATSKHLQKIIEMCRFQKWIFVLTPREELADLMVKLPPRCIGPTRQNDLTSPRQSNPKGFLKSGAAI